MELNELQQLVKQRKIKAGLDSKYKERIEKSFE